MSDTYNAAANNANLTAPTGPMEKDFENGKIIDTLAPLEATS